MGHMHANLVRAPGFQSALHPGRHRLFSWAKRLQHLIVGYSFLAALGQHAHFLAGLRFAPQRSIDGAFTRRGHTPHKRLIAALESALASVISELFCKCVVRRVTLCDHHEPARILVYPVDDAGALDAANP